MKIDSTLQNIFNAKNSLGKSDKGYYFYNQEDKPQNIFFLRKGLVGLFRSTSDGTERFLRLFYPGCIFGHRSYLAEQNYHASALALENCEYSFLPVDEYLKFANSDSKHLLKMAKHLAFDLGNAEARLTDQIGKSAFQRIAEAIYFLKLKSPSHQWTRKDVADFSGSTIESVARAITALEQDGVLLRKGRSIEILDNTKYYNLLK